MFFYDRIMIIEKELIELVNKGYTQRKIAELLSYSQTNVRHWLNKYNLKTLQKRKEREAKGLKYCPCCKKVKSINEFYQRRGKKGGSTYCKSCTNTESSVRQVNFKQKCVNYKGGTCEICGYDKSIGSLEFHHIDSSEKDFQISKVKSHSFSDTVKKELDKCMLLCRNCHGEIHFNPHKNFIRNKEGTWIQK